MPSQVKFYPRRFFYFLGFCAVFAGLVAADRALHGGINRLLVIGLLASILYGALIIPLRMWRARSDPRKMWRVAHSSRNSILPSRWRKWMES